MSIFRQYTLDNSFEQVFVPTDSVKEYQIALTFARDYDEHDAPTTGIFRPTWDTTKVTAESITRFKKKYPNIDVKVFISIGNRGTQFPFQPQDNQKWISNATKSLTDIIKSSDIQVDGIDVWYESIKASTDDFVGCVGKVIENLKQSGVVSVASISPSSTLNKDYYSCLFSSCPLFIDWVDYQFQNEVTPVYTPDDLVDRYHDLVKFYPMEKLFAGYSAENEDWRTVSPIVFFVGSMTLLTKEGAPGASIYYNSHYAQAPNME